MSKVAVVCTGLLAATEATALKTAQQIVECEEENKFHVHGTMGALKKLDGVNHDFAHQSKGWYAVICDGNPKVEGNTVTGCFADCPDIVYQSNNVRKGGKCKRKVVETLTTEVVCQF